MSRPLTLVKGEGIPDWYSIEWAEHENRYWTEERDAGGYPYYALCYSGRPSDACIEGTSAEMAAIATAIEQGGSVSFRRCEAISLDNGSYGLSSPRNSQFPAIVTKEQAQHLAAEIRRVLREQTNHA